MKRLPLYDDSLPLAEVESTEPLDINHGCRRCPLNEGVVGKVCLNPAGEAGGLLAVLPSPTKADARAGRSWISRTASYTRDLLMKHYDGPICFDYALKCPAPIKNDKGRKRTPVQWGKIADQCRPYLASTFEEAEPDRVVLFGKRSIETFLGRRFEVSKVRRAYTWARRKDGKKVPVFMLRDPFEAVKNRFVKKEFEADLEWAMNVDPSSLNQPEGYYVLVEDVKTAKVAAMEAADAGEFSFDCETGGRAYNADFRNLCVAVAIPGVEEVFVWTEEALKDPFISMPLKDILLNPRIAVNGANVKYDMLVVHSSLGVMPTSVRGDTRLQGKLIDGESDGSLEAMAETVGYGGHKKENEKALKKAVQFINTQRRRIFGDTKKKPDPMDDWTLSAVKSGRTPKEFAYALVPKDVLYRYCARDAQVTQVLNDKLVPVIESDEGNKMVWDELMMPGISSIAQMEAWGMPVSKNAVIALGKLLRPKLDHLEKRIHKYGDEIKVSNNNDLSRLLYKTLKLKPTKFTATGAPSTDADALTDLKGRHPVVEDILAWRKLDKLRSTYADGMLEFITSDGRIHPNLKLDGARTGRMSCVAPWTLVKTRSGLRPIKDIQVGDLVWTHKLRWQPVTRFIDQGVRNVYDVHLSNGQVLTCTGDHRLLLSDGTWVKVDTINERFQELGRCRREQGKCGAPVPSEGAPFDHGGYSGMLGDYIPQRISRDKELPSRGREEGASYLKVLGLQAGFQEPHEGEERSFSPQLEGSLRGRVWLPNGCSQRETEILAQSGYGRSLGAGGPAREISSSPHRRRQKEQLSRQLSSCNCYRARDNTLLAGKGTGVVEIEKVDYRGDSQVYDLTVAVDHSYETLGVFSHNCTQPNLQNIPRAKSSPEAKQAKSVFIAEDGKVLVQLDFSQLELRVAAWLSGDPLMIDIYRRGVDFHMETARLISKIAWGIRPDQVGDNERSLSKATTFGLIYGKTDRGLAADFRCAVEEAAKVRRGVLGNFKRLDKFMKTCISDVKRTGHSRTYWRGKPGRHRQLYDIASSNSERKSNATNAAQNSPIQGSASEFCLASINKCVDYILSSDVNAKLVISVHDSLILEVEESIAQSVAADVKHLMEDQDCGEVPLVVDVEMGKTWGALKKYDPIKGEFLE